MVGDRSQPGPGLVRRDRGNLQLEKAVLDGILDDVARPRKPPMERRKKLGRVAPIQHRQLVSIHRLPRREELPATASDVGL